MENRIVVHWVSKELLDRYEYGACQRHAPGLQAAPEIDERDMRFTERK